jgi:NAD(P)-dependent dehydrogenase (short-subunit alcohol dehydrogenase family)
MLISTGTLQAQSLEGQIAIISGAGRGIGYETARALLWLGVTVMIAEIDPYLGREASERLSGEFGTGKVVFIEADIGSDRGVDSLKKRTLRTFGVVDILINNATVTPIGAVLEVPIEQWDKSYCVNLRGPILLTQAFLPGMVERDHGVIVCVSSVGEAYMGAYETFKAAQVQLSSTLDAELEGTNVHAFTIDPGLVHTPGLQIAAEKLAPLYGMTIEEFYSISGQHELSVEAAGSGFAAAVALAHQFRGQEISSKQALLAAGIDLMERDKAREKVELAPERLHQAISLCRLVRKTLKEQSDGWSERSLFERQWMFRDFKKNAGMSIERWLDSLIELEKALEEVDPTALRKMNPLLDHLVRYYDHMQDLARGYEKDESKLEEQLKIIQEWQEDVNRLVKIIKILNLNK